MVIPSRPSRPSSRPLSTLSKLLIQLSLVFLVGVVYTASISKSPSNDNHHWQPPFLDWLLGPSHDDAPGKKDIFINHETLSNTSTTLKALPSVPVNVPKLQSKLKLKLSGDTKHVGIMVDAGRHYFPIPWLEALLHYMAGLGYNWLHLRLTDDQAFAVQFESHPELALAAPFYDQVYTVEELKGLVATANKLGITIVPELNVPGHAASWHHIPGLIVPCPHFTCTYGYAIPLNIESPKLLPILKDLLTEIKAIFGSTYLHLGGDELEQAEGCFQEIGQALPDYASFEASLETMVQELGFEHVLRWERTNSTTTQRAGDITQYWMKDIDDYSEELPSNFFSSAGLYMDVNEDDNAYKVYQQVRKNQNRHPQGIVVGTFELGTDWWMDRNVFGRMIAVSMAFLGDIHDDETAFAQAYQEQCTKLLGQESDMCSRDGQPKVPYLTWRGEQRDKRFGYWKVQVCTRVTDPFEKRIMRTIDPLSDEFNTRQAEVIARARKIFLQRHRNRQNKQMPKELFQKNKYGKLMASEEAYYYTPRTNHHALFQHRVGHTGITVDLSRYFFPMERLHELVERMSHLGFNTLHLRLVDDFAFVVETRSHPDVAWAAKEGGSVYTFNELREFVVFGHSLSVEIIPEVNMVARSGGWFAAGFVAPCPNHICEQGYGIPLNLTNVPLMAAFSNVVEEIRLAFNSPFLHLGYDERGESVPCFQEANIKVDFNEVEKKVAALLSVHEIPLRLVMRWQSSEDDSSDERLRAGVVTHYQWTNPPKNVTDPFFVSTDLRFDRRNDDAYQIYLKAREYAEHDMVLGVLAGTMEMSPQAWNGRNVEGKMIAMAIGLSTKQEMDEDNFKKVYTETCSELKIEGDIGILFGKSRWTEDRWQEELKNGRERRTNTTCSRMTGLTHSRKMKGEILG